MSRIQVGNLSLNDSIERLWKLVDEKRQQIPNLRIFLITEQKWLRVYKGQREMSTQFEEFAFIRDLKPERGAIINFFSKLEVLVNELIQTKILGLSSDKAYDFDLVLECIDFSRRVWLMKKWGMISNNEVEKITKISEVRNQLAHRWSEKEVTYGNDDTGKPISISDNIVKFKEDAEKICTNLIAKYVIEEEKHIGRVIQQFEDSNTLSTLWPFPMHDFKWVFDFHAHNTFLKASFIVCYSYILLNSCAINYLFTIGKVNENVAPLPSGLFSAHILPP